MLMANGAYESARRIVAIPREHLDVRGDDTFTLVLVPGIAETMARAAAEGLLLSEAGVPWARPTDPFDLAGYDTFPSRWSAR
jgi:hypothetical protein